MAERMRERFRLYSVQEWRTAALLFVGYLGVYALKAHYVPAGVHIYPSSPIALAGLFFGGPRLWPVVLLAALIAVFASGMSIPFALIYAISITLQAVVGASLLRQVRIDPLFRRYRDTFYFIEISLLTSLLLPTLTGLLHVVLGQPFDLLDWWYSCAAMETCVLIIMPFILRWFAKIRFSRTPIEGVETVAIFAVLIGLDLAIFPLGITKVVGVPLIYFLLVPLFWIALRLRPRFVTLALLLTSILAIGAAIIHGDASTLPATLYNTELFLIALAILFFTIVSLEEDRRVNTNLLRSQLFALENAVARVSSESKAKNDFIAILAHELRNPLAPVMSGIELMRLKGTRDAEDLDTLAMMEDRMETIRRLLDDLLDISRITEGKIALKREPLELESIIRRAVLSTEHYIKERHQNLVLKFPKRQKYVLGDPVRLEQVFSNLITNASKYTHSGDTITLSMQRIGDEEIEVRISDHGIGISADQLEAIFTPFHQAEEAGKSKKGLGIGLALVRSFVEMHQGTVVAKSAGPGKGSEFSVRLPLHAVVEEPKKRQARTSAPTRSGLTVLVVDDNDAAAAGIGRLLELRGCRVSYAYDGRQAIAQTASLTPDVVLLDVGLPDRDGYEVAKTLRGEGYTGRLIALSGFSTDDARERANAAGFDHYLVKPAGLADLARVIPEIG